MGLALEPTLRDALAKQPSAEARSRIEALLSELRPDPSSGKPSRELIAVGLLGRIGTPAAIDYLGDLAAGSEGGPLTAEARRALKEFARED